ncbi:DUF637 domain-containing protein, partial [Variovorax sp. JS1663]|uniref:DUF637 domain-containing protein n=1 Tax=Variovorax sp. JS1663 TaxID=1851577 RepID=UPI001EDEAFE0
AATSAGMGATVSAGASGAVQMGVSAIASQAAVSLANNDGDLGKVLKELGSSESIKAIATSMLTAGVIEGLGASGLLPKDVASTTNGSARFTAQLQRQLINNAAGAVVRSAVNGTSLEDELRDGLVNALLNTAAAQGAFQIGQWTSPGIDPVTGAATPPALNRFAGEVAHAIVGCAVGAGRATAAAGTTGNGCAAGALGAVAGHLTAQFINPTGDQGQASATTEVSRLVGAIAAAIAGGDETAIYVASNAAGNAVENNWLSRKRPNLLGLSEQDQYDAAVKACNAGDKEACDTRTRWMQLSSGRDGALRDACAAGGASTGCLTEVQRAQAAGNAIFVDGRGNIIVNGVAFATAGPITSPFTTSTAGQMAQSTADGILLEIGNQASGAVVGAAWQLGRNVVGRIFYSADNAAIKSSLAQPLTGDSATFAVDRSAGSIRNVNPGYPQLGRTQNCINCSIATDATLAGNPASALPAPRPKSIAILEAQYGTRFGPRSTPETIEELLLLAGNGARGIIYGARGPGEAGHVFNVVNQNGIIRFLDGQSGTIADFNGYTTFHLLRTN